MANLTFNISLAAVKSIVGSLGAANDALILVPIETTGLEADATLRDHDELNALLGGTSNEQTTAGRKTITAVTPTVDDSANTFTLDCADQVYTSIAASNAISAWVIGFDADTTSGTDANVQVLTKHDLAWTPDGNTFTVAIANFFSASS